MKIGYCFFPSLQDDYSKYTNKLVEDIFADLGYNSGNLLFLNAGLTFLATGKNTNLPNLESAEIMQEVVNIRTVHDVIINKPLNAMVFMFANLIGPHTGDEYIMELTNMLMLSECKCIAMGLGSQIDYDAFKQNERILSDKLVNLLRLLSSKCNNIFIRDENTKKILAHLDIKNSIVSGCPSILLNTNLKLGDIIDEKIRYLKNNPKDIRATVNYQSSSEYDLFTKKIISLAKQSKSSIVIQDNPTTIKKLLIDPKIPMKLIDSNFTLTEFQQNFRFFYKLDAWMLYLKNFNLCVGARIHGAIINIVNETPAINICHDVRTKGLCESLKIPHINRDVFMKMSDEKLNMNHILSLINFNKDEFNQMRSQMALLYKQELELMGIMVSENLKKLANS